MKIRVNTSKEDMIEKVLNQLKSSMPNADKIQKENVKVYAKTTRDNTEVEINELIIEVDNEQIHSGV